MTSCPFQRFTPSQERRNIIEAIIYSTLIGMVFEDIDKKGSWVNTWVPIGYWAVIIGAGGFSSFFSTHTFDFIMLFIGVCLAAIQLHYTDTLKAVYKKLTGKKKISIEQFPRVVPFLKQNKLIVFFGIVILGYGLISFIFMCIGVKNEAIWFLIAIYLLGNIYNIILKISRYSLWDFFVVGLNWMKK